MKDVRRNPHVYTSKEAEATAAANGGTVYVFEVCASEKAGRTYALGYKYRADEKLSRPGGQLWDGTFKYKVCATPNTPAAGMYFDRPVIIEDAKLLFWLKAQTLGMAKIPSDMVATLDVLIADPANGAKPFA
jgi:hypothetical protein